ncbi:MAG: DUF167 domain-containing protein [Phycisphaeraceae bacterium]|nr:DUF167 domain-containing protein [Phycisphaeraceae bacterium]
MIRLEQSGADLLLFVKVVPGARHPGIVGAHGDRLRIRVASPAEDGRANEDVCRLIAALLDLRERDVRIESGARSREKSIRLTGGDVVRVRARLAEAEARRS